MPTLMKYYKFSILFAIVAIVAGFFIGGLKTAVIIAILGILETSLSFDNAVVNARVLANWDHKWRQRFLKWGILIAVFGMRVIFPLAIVSVATGIGPMAVTDLALNHATEYAQRLTSVHHEVAGFGGAFLFLVAFSFFFEEKQAYWWEAIEARLAKFGALDSGACAIVLVISYVVSTYMDAPRGSQFFIAAVFGVVTFIVAHGLGSVLGGSDDDEDADVAQEGSPNMGGTLIKASLAGFLYLEILDASFSFDGVIGAFVLSNYLPVIALGLGIGAFFVRSMTIHLVEAGMLSEYRYLEHGAFYAILALAVIMYASAVGLHLPEWLTGLLSVVFIFLAFWHSVVHNRRDAKTEAVAVTAA